MQRTIKNTANVIHDTCLKLAVIIQKNAIQHKYLYINTKFYGKNIIKQTFF